MLVIPALFGEASKLLLFSPAFLRVFFFTALATATILLRHVVPLHLRGILLLSLAAICLPLAKTNLLAEGRGPGFSTNCCTVGQGLGTDGEGCLISMSALVSVWEVCTY